MKAAEKNYILTQIDESLDAVRKGAALGNTFDVKRALITLKSEVGAMSIDEEEFDDWSAEVEARLDRLEQRLSWVEFASIGIGRKGGGGRGNSVFDS